MTPADQLLCGYVIPRAAEEPLLYRAKLYRALAARLPEDSREFRDLTTRADECEELDRACRQLGLDLGTDETHEAQRPQS